MPFLHPGNVADNNLDTMVKHFGKLKGYAFADKGFINARASESLMNKGLLLITKLKNNMKNKLLKMEHKMLLNKRGLIELVNDILKTVCDVEHSRHRSPINALVNPYAGPCAYSWLDRKPSVF
jgi:Transposase DDE domain